jgi:Na+-driven multidrug efflux pump
MLGNEIGAGDKDKAILYAKRFLIIGSLAGLLLGILLVLISPIVLMMFSNTQAVQQLAQKIMFIMGIFLWCRFMNGILVVGVLRSGGDTTFSMVLETCSVWLVGVPLAFAGALWWHLPVYAVYILICFEELIKAYFGIKRVRSHKWVKDVR